MNARGAASSASKGGAVAPEPALAGRFLQRQCACGNHAGGKAECDACASKKVLQRKSTSATALGEIPPIVSDALRTPGQPLDRATRALVEPQFGHDFSQVRVHTDASAAHSAAAIGASAYTSGNDIVFGSGRYAPGRERGDRLLAHELTHVVQQARWGGGAPAQKALGDPNDAPELEADAVADRVMRREPVRVTQPPSAALHGDLSDGAKVGIGFGIAGGVIGLGFGIAALAGAFDKKKPRNLKQCEKLAADLRKHPVYVSTLTSEERAIVDDIISVAFGREDCLDYLEKLEGLLDTRPGNADEPPGDPADPEEIKKQEESRRQENTTKNRKSITDSVQEEEAFKKTPEGKAEDTNRQEALATARAGKMTQRTGRKDSTGVQKTYLVDSTDPNDVVVRVRILLVAKGTSTEEDIEFQVSLEDAIERIAETRGYVVDVDFAKADGPDVFVVQSDVGDWPTSANVVGGARTLAHEFHHLLNLPDLYDYIAIHAKNPRMPYKQRLKLFRWQMDRPYSEEKDKKSLMGKGNKLQDEEVCAVAGLDAESCKEKRAEGTP